jgi:3D (Asp-Asp-Asp) domain-containing protein
MLVKLRSTGVIARSPFCCRAIVLMFILLSVSQRLTSQDGAPQGERGAVTNKQPYKQVVSDDNFSFLAPTDFPPATKRLVWLTAYIQATRDEDASSSAVQLRNPQGMAMGVGLSHGDWCNAADEGTVRVVLKSGKSRVFNSALASGGPYSDCKDIFRNMKPSVLAGINKMTFVEIPAESFGLGVKSYSLVPYRSIAVDLSGKGIVPLGSVLFIPKLRGLQIVLPDGRHFTHDGYVMAVDRVDDCGGKGDPQTCNRNHIDLFMGRTQTDAVPHELYSTVDSPIEAFQVTDSSIASILLSDHIRR